MDSSLAIGEMAAEETCTDTVTLEAEDTGREQAIHSLECIAGGACIFPESNGVCLERFESGVILLWERVATSENGTLESPVCTGSSN